MFDPQKHSTLTQYRRSLEGRGSLKSFAMDLGLELINYGAAKKQSLLHQCSNGQIPLAYVDNSATNENVIPLHQNEVDRIIDDFKLVPRGRRAFFDKGGEGYKHRLDERLGHHLVRNVDKQKGSNNAKQLSCVYCKSKTTWICRACKAPLCFNIRFNKQLSCHERFHREDRFRPLESGRSKKRPAPTQRSRPAPGPQTPAQFRRVETPISERNQADRAASRPVVGVSPTPAMNRRLRRPLGARQPRNHIGR